MPGLIVAGATTTGGTPVNSNDDRTHESGSNIVLHEHVNVTIPDQRTATLFYVSAPGVHPRPVPDGRGWRTCGSTSAAARCTCPPHRPQRLRGAIGLVVPDLTQLEQRLQRVAPELEGTRFGFANQGSFVSVTCPWGNRFRCHRTGAEVRRSRARHALRRVRSSARQRRGHRPLLFRDLGRTARSSLRVTVLPAPASARARISACWSPRNLRADPALRRSSCPDLHRRLRAAPIAA